MIFGRKTRAEQADDVAPDVTDEAEVEGTDPDDTDEASEVEGVEDLSDATDEAAADDEAADDEAADEVEADDDVDGDPRADGPFDITEVDLGGDEVERLSLGPLTITPFDDMGLQFQGDPDTQVVYSALIMHENSGLQIELFAAPTTSGLADELREDTVVEAQQGGGSTELSDGPFGKEIKRVLPIEGPEGEQLFHVSRLWLVDGPRWLLRGTLMGQAALVDGEEPPADVFAEFFRNIVVHRDDSPRVPGELLTLTLPTAPDAEG